MAKSSVALLVVLALVLAWGAALAETWKDTKVLVPGEKWETYLKEASAQAPRINRSKCAPPPNLPCEPGWQRTCRVEVINGQAKRACRTIGKGMLVVVNWRQCFNGQGQKIKDYRIGAICTKKP